MNSSLFDDVTGLYNRAYFEAELDRLDSGRYNPVGLIVCFVDGLKTVAPGDEAWNQRLKLTAEIIKKEFRIFDLVARLEADEFAVVLPNCAKAAAENAVFRITEAISRYNESNPDSPLRLSIGCAVGDDFVAASVRDLAREAVKNTYKREKVNP